MSAQPAALEIAVQCEFESSGCRFNKMDGASVDGAIVICIRRAAEKQVRHRTEAVADNSYRRTEVIEGLAEALRTAGAVEGTYILRALYDFGETSPETGQAVAAVLHELDGTAFHCAIGIIGNSGARDPDTVIVMHAAERRCDDDERKWRRLMLAKVEPPPKATRSVDT